MRQVGFMWLISDRDEEIEPMYGMCGSLDAEFEEQRTIKRAELTAFFSLLTRIVGPTTARQWRQEVKDQKRKMPICGFCRFHHKKEHS